MWELYTFIITVEERTRQVLRLEGICRIGSSFPRALLLWTHFEIIPISAIPYNIFIPIEYLPYSYWELLVFGENEQTWLRSATSSTVTCYIIHDAGRVGYRTYSDQNHSQQALSFSGQQNVPLDSQVAFTAWSSWAYMGPTLYHGPWLGPPMRHCKGIRSSHCTSDVCTIMPNSHLSLKPLG